MSHSRQQPQEADDGDSEPEMLAVDDALEEVDDDVAMDSGDDDDDVGMDDDEAEELMLVNDSVAYLDEHKDSVFAIAQHPRFPALVATGGSEGAEDDAPGRGYVIDTSTAEAGVLPDDARPLLPPSYSNDPAAAVAAAAAAAAARSTALRPLFSIDGHADSINALAFTQPAGDFLVSGGMDGRLRVYSVVVTPDANCEHSVGDVRIAFVSESQEVPEITWLAPAPAPAAAAGSSASAANAVPNVVALGASDGSVWVLSIDPAADAANPLQILQSYFLHTAACTAGSWTPDGNLLATVSEDGSLHVWDVWGVAAARGVVSRGSGAGASAGTGQTAVSLTADDQRFEVEGGLYSVAVSPGGGIVAVGGAGGAIKIVGLPRLATPTASVPAPASNGPAGRRSQPAFRRGGASAGGDAAANAQVGVILASIQVQSDGIETLSFAPPPLTLLAAGSVDGSIAVYDASRSFAVRRHMKAAHDEFSVVKVEWVRSPPGSVSSGGSASSGPAQWLLTSCGMDGVVRRWDVRAAGAAGLVKEWRGHRGDGEGGGVLGFVQGATGERIVTAGDDGVVLVFAA